MNLDMHFNEKFSETLTIHWGRNAEDSFENSKESSFYLPIIEPVTSHFMICLGADGKLKG
jgi:hypothetical protein